MWAIFKDENDYNEKSIIGFPLSDFEKSLISNPFFITCSASFCFDLLTPYIVHFPFLLLFFHAMINPGRNP